MALRGQWLTLPLATGQFISAKQAAVTLRKLKTPIGTAGKKKTNTRDFIPNSLAKLAQAFSPDRTN